MIRQTEHGFVVQYTSDIDGDRYAIIESLDAEMSGWKVEVAPDEAWYTNSWGGDGTVPTYHKPRIEEFTREHCWFRAGSNWNGLGFGEAGHPWSVMVDHNERIVRWIPPDK